MTAFVTGATGFLGGRLAHLLCRRGEEVTVLARATSDLSGLPDTVNIAQGDITDREAIERGLDAHSDVDVVYHLAARNDLGEPDPALMQAINVDGTRNVLEAAAERGLVSVYVSSATALGPTGSKAEDESWWAPSVPQASYAITKRRAHEVAHQLAENGARVRIAMPGYIYGAGDPTPLSGVLKRYIDARIPIGYLPEVWQSFVHVEDCAELLTRIASRGRDGESYLAVERAASMRELFETMGQLAGQRPALFWMKTSLVVRMSGLAILFSALTGLGKAEMRESLAMVAGGHWSFSGEKAKRELGWQPRELSAGLEDVVAALRNP
ncbi:MAG: NAD-dependent epimerase/dehydratase family protein [Deltaproteobacteria bacterium]|nr:NAD-dependent epimerase/dehydratase family protein [Deltaproteobacteria bacterium]MBW2362658.1 NAD-dependent epimerase/dehydratase family protein [Deltaproteobacteria bacterium]